MNEDIPCASLDEKAPLEVFAKHYHSGRCYRPEVEDQLFDLKLVHKFLAQKFWTRKVSKNGTVKIAKKNYSLGKSKVEQKIKITFDPDKRDFLFNDEDGLLLARRSAKGLGKERIMGSAPIALPIGFQLQFPFDSQKELELRLYETPPTMSL